MSDDDKKGPLGPFAFLFVLFSTLVMIFSGGCTLFFLVNSPMFWDGVLVVGGVPFLLAALVFWLAWTYGRVRPEESHFDRGED